MEALPIDDALDAVRAAVARGRTAVVVAPPGSGKSTRVPPALLAGSNGQVLLLQPRRVAAIALAERIAREQGWRLGREVGYRVRFERMGEATTRLWVMTEGTLTRRLLSDPYLDGVGTVVLDEVHERSIHTDLALAYLKELATSVRPDLRVVAMSATIDAAPLARFLLDAPVISSAARAHPVAIRLVPQDARSPFGERVAAGVREALRDPECGDVLAFLPGAGEIRACARALEGLPQEVVPLHGQLPPAEQSLALRPGERQRVVLATNVAETSVTIPGVRTVVDGGFARVASMDPASGVEELTLEPIARANADQRAGRAGRTAPGRCLRLWSALADAQLAPLAIPEVRRIDLTEACVAILRLGYAPEAFPWFEAPEPARLAHATRLLALLGATDAQGRLTPHGERLAQLPLHPRQGNVLVAAAAANRPRLGATLAALAQERDLLLRPGPQAPPAEPAMADALTRMELLEQAERARHADHLRQVGIDPQASRQVARARDEILAAWKSANAGWAARAESAPSAAEVAALVHAGHPDRVARRSAADPNRATMVGGVAIEIDRASCLYADRAERAPLVVASELARIQRGAHQVVVLRQGAETSEDALARAGSALAREEALEYDRASARVVSRVRWRYRDLVVREAVGEIRDAAAASEVLARALAPEADAIIAEDHAAASFIARARWLALAKPQPGVDAPDATALARAVAACCSGCVSRAEVIARPKLPWLAAELDPRAVAAVEALAPEAINVPSGRSIRLDYAQADAVRAPILAVRLQELFGLAQGPRIAGGIPVLLHLLAPNYRVEQITSDLASFWANTYAQVRKDLRARYPKHAWPDDPLSAPPQAKGPSSKR